MQTDEAFANAVARSAMGEVAWPTVVLGLAVIASYVGLLSAYLLGWVPLWLATLLLAGVLYASYTVLHEAVHGSINGQDRTLKWLNNALGFTAGQMIGTAFLAHRKEHLAHHANTNHEGRDPDLALAGKGGLPLLLGTLRALPHQVAYYFRNNWANASPRDRAIVCLETGVALAWRLGLVIVLGPVAAFFLLVVANLIGIFVTLVLFAWIVHRPHTETGRYRDTASFVLPTSIDTVVSWLWLFQNYHAIHHLFPRIPFYRYRAVFRQIRPVMEHNGAPIYEIGVPRRAALDLRSD